MWRRQWWLLQDPKWFIHWSVSLRKCEGATGLWCWNSIGCKEATGWWIWSSLQFEGATSSWFWNSIEHKSFTDRDIELQHNVKVLYGWWCWNSIPWIFFEIPIIYPCQLLISSFFLGPKSQTGVSNTTPVTLMTLLVFASLSGKETRDERRICRTHFRRFLYKLQSSAKRPALPSLLYIIMLMIISF